METEHIYAASELIEQPVFTMSTVHSRISIHTHTSTYRYRPPHSEMHLHGLKGAYL